MGLLLDLLQQEGGPPHPLVTAVKGGANGSRWLRRLLAAENDDYANQTAVDEDVALAMALRELV